MDLLGHYSKRTSWTKGLRRLAEATIGDRSDAVRRHRVSVVILSTSRVTELVDDYHAGTDINELSVRFGVHRTTVVQHLHRSGVQMRRRGLDDHQIDHAVHLYQQGLSLVRIGARLDVHAETVRQALLARGMRMRAPWERG